MATAFTQWVYEWESEKCLREKGLVNNIILGNCISAPSAPVYLGKYSCILYFTTAIYEQNK